MRHAPRWRQLPHTQSPVYFDCRKRTGLQSRRSSLCSRRSVLRCRFQCNVSRERRSGQSSGQRLLFTSPETSGRSARAVFLIGLLCVLLRIERSAYQYASITLTIVMLVTRSTSGPLIAIHRFFEVSLGLAVGLMLSAIWPERTAANLGGNASTLKIHLCLKAIGLPERD
jgi:hypothetical protein